MKRPASGAGQRQQWQRMGLLELPQAVLASVSAFLPKSELLGLALVARAGAAFGAEVRVVFLTPAPLLEDPRQPTTSTWVSFVDRHAACLERLLRRLPRLQTIFGYWSVFYMQAAFAGALLRGGLALPSVRRLVLVEEEEFGEEGDDSDEELDFEEEEDEMEVKVGPGGKQRAQQPREERRVVPLKPKVFAFDYEPSFETPQGRACFLLLAAAEGRLPGLRAVDFGALGKTRSIGEEGTARRFIARLGEGALPEMDALTVDGEALGPGVFFQLGVALKERAARVGQPLAATGAGGRCSPLKHWAMSPLPLRDLRVCAVRPSTWAALGTMLDSGLCERLESLDVSGQLSLLGGIGPPPPAPTSPAFGGVGCGNSWSISQGAYQQHLDQQQQQQQAASGHHHPLAALNTALALLEDSAGASLPPIPLPGGRAAHRACPMLTRGAEAIGAWLKRTRAPRLKAFSTNAVAATFTPLAGALASPGVAPVLEELCLSRLRTQGLRELGRLLALGRLPALRSLALYEANITDAHLAGFLRDVRGPAARGLPGMEELILYSPRWQRFATLEEEEAHWGVDAAGGLDGPRALLDGLRAGCFPRLRRLELFLDEDPDDLESGDLLSEDEILLLLADALAPLARGGGGAPCGATLEEVEIHNRVLPETLKALREALPNARVRAPVVDEEEMEAAVGGGVN